MAEQNCYQLQQGLSLCMRMFLSAAVVKCEHVDASMQTPHRADMESCFRSLCTLFGFTGGDASVGAEAVGRLCVEYDKIKKHMPHDDAFPTLCCILPSYVSFPNMKSVSLRSGKTIHESRLRIIFAFANSALHLSSYAAYCDSWGGYPPMVHSLWTLVCHLYIHARQKVFGPTRPVFTYTGSKRLDILMFANRAVMEVESDADKRYAIYCVALLELNCFGEVEFGYLKEKVKIIKSALRPDGAFNCHKLYAALDQQLNGNNGPRCVVYILGICVAGLSSVGTDTQIWCEWQNFSTQRHQAMTIYGDSGGNGTSIALTC